MGLRRTALERAQADLREAEQRKTKHLAELETAEAVVAEAEASLEEARASESAAYAEERDLDDARSRRAEAEEQVRRVRADLRRIQGYGPAIERRVEEARAAVRAAERDDAEVRYRDALAERNEAVVAFTRSPSLAALEAMERKRREAEEARERLAELHVGDWPEIPAEDEPVFPEGSDRVAQALAAGPRRPREETARLAKLARERRSAEYGHLLSVIRSHGTSRPGSPSTCGRRPNGSARRWPST